MTTLQAVVTSAMITMIAAAGALAPAAAQSTFGDTRLSYSNGVVYDDDLVPGRPLNQGFLVGEGRQRAGTVPGARSPRAIPRNSRNLIGADGRIRGTTSRDLQRPRVRIQP